MPDITDQILRETTPNPIYHPLSPTVEELEEYNEDLDYWGNQLTIEWATREMKGHQMSWVRVGLVADRVRRYRLYKDDYPNWNEYCQDVLGKQAWQMKKIIDAALATMALVREGFSILPTCVSQATELIKCCFKGETLLTDAWYTVLEQCPLPHCITRTRIGEALGFPIENNNIPKQYRDRIKYLADRDGVTISEKLDELIALDEELDIEPTNDTELDEVDPDLPEEEQQWYKEMKRDVEHHDSQIWFMAAIAKLINPAPKVSQFNWLRTARYHT